MLLLIETALALLALVLSGVLTRFEWHGFGRVESAFSGIARRRSLSVMLVVASAILGRLIALPVLPTPVPRVDDEYSHLLLADTLLHGRLANPTHPMWLHFETSEVLMRPTYASVYQPMQGIFLALGRLLSGSPFVGVMLSVGVMCGAICWMMQGLMSAEWALLGGLLAVCRFSVFSYWADSYMGGAPAAIGGALVLGAFFRLRKDARSRNAVILGIGAAILGNSRPYEGVVLGALVCIYLFCSILKLSGAGLQQGVRYVIIPLVLVVLLAGSFTCFYFWRITGSPFRSPYELVWDTYGMMPKFMWQRLRPPQESTLRHEALTRKYYVWERSSYDSTRTLRGVLNEWGVRSVLNFEFFLGPLLALPLLAAIGTAPYGFGWKQLDQRIRFLLVCAAVVGIALSVEVFSYPHYAAPITCVVFSLVVLAMRHLRSQHYRGKPFGLWLCRVIPVLTLLMLVLRAASGLLQIPLAPSYLPSLYYSVHEKVPGNLADEYLRKIPGKHLVIVHYALGTETWMGWVHNEADIDESKIVWAWDMGAVKNQELVTYFLDRQRRIWRADSADPSGSVKPYSKELDK